MCISSCRQTNESSFLMQNKHPPMKHLILLISLSFFISEVSSQTRTIDQPPTVTSNDRNRKVDVTFVINGSTIRISGIVRLNILTSTLVFEGSITVTGNGNSVEVPIHYDGPLKKGPNNYKYDRAGIQKEDLVLIEWATSRLYFEKKKIRFDSNIDPARNFSND